MRTPERLMVVAPHPDDDAIGCGGTLARTAARGASIVVVYVTDGAASHPNSKRYPPKVLRQVRRREAIEGLRALGVHTPPVFLDVPDGRVTTLSAFDRELAIGALEGCLTWSACDFVLGPWRWEPHPDHAAVASLLAAALGRIPRRPASLSYAVWLEVFGTSADRPAPGNPYVDIHLSPHELARKRAAIMQHASQVSALIDDDPQGFRAPQHVLDLWLAPVERFYADTAGEADQANDALVLGTTRS